MRVVVRSHGDIKRIIGSGRRTLELDDGATVRDLVLELGGNIEGSESIFLSVRRRIDSDLVVLLNGHNIRALGGIDTILKEGDFITFMPVIVGG